MKSRTVWWVVAVLAAPLLLIRFNVNAKRWSINGRTYLLAKGNPELSMISRSFHSIKVSYATNNEPCPIRVGAEILHKNCSVRVRKGASQASMCSPPYTTVDKTRTIQTKILFLVVWSDGNSQLFWRLDLIKLPKKSDSNLILARSVLVCGREQRPL